MILPREFLVGRKIHPDSIKSSDVGRLCWGRIVNGVGRAKGREVVIVTGKSVLFCGDDGKKRSISREESLATLKMMVQSLVILRSITPRLTVAESSTSLKQDVLKNSISCSVESPLAAGFAFAATFPRRIESKYAASSA